MNSLLIVVFLIVLSLTSQRQYYLDSCILYIVLPFIIPYSPLISHVICPGSYVTFILFLIYHELLVLQWLLNIWPTNVISVNE